MTPDAHGQRGNHVASVNQLSRRTNPIHYLTGVFLMRSEMVIFCIMIIDMIIQTGLLDLLLYFIITSYSCPEAAVQSQIITPPSCVVLYINFIYAASVMIEIILVLYKNLESEPQTGNRDGEISPSTGRNLYQDQAEAWHWLPVNRQGAGVTAGYLPRHCLGLES